MGWNELNENTRYAIARINDDIEAAQSGIDIKGRWANSDINNLTREDMSYLRDEVIRLLKEGRQTLYAGDK